MKSLTFITGNAGKAEQLSRYLQFQVMHQKLDIPEIQSLDLEEVATEKAKTAYQLLGTPVLVEDTALTFAALNGLPGPLVKWFLETIGNDGMANLLSNHKNRAALAETCFVLCDETGVHLFKAAVEGTIATTPRAVAAFGWDPIFIPKGSEYTWAEMDRETQAKFSLRRKAVEKLQIYLEENYR